MSPACILYTQWFMDIKEYLEMPYCHPKHLAS